MDVGKLKNYRHKYINIYTYSVWRVHKSFHNYFR